MVSRYKVKQAASNVMRKLIVAGALVGTGWYHVGTMEETEAKVQSYTSNGGYGDTGFEGKYIFKTDKGEFIAEKATLHGVSHQDVSGMYTGIYAGKTYKFNTWGGIPQIGIDPKISSFREVTEEELKEREFMKTKRAQEEAIRKRQAVAAPQNPEQPVAVQQQAAGAPVSAVGALSGRVQTLDVVFNNSVIQLTVPVEAAGKVTINSVTPLQVQAPAPAPIPAAAPVPAPKSPGT